MIGKDMPKKKWRSLKKFQQIILLFKKNFYEYRSKIVSLSILGFISGILEGVGVNALVPLFSMATRESNTGTDIISQTLERIFLFLHIPFSLKFLLLFILLL